MNSYRFASACHQIVSANEACDIDHNIISGHNIGFTKRSAASPRRIDRASRERETPPPATGAATAAAAAAAGSTPGAAAPEDAPDPRVAHAVQVPPSTERPCAARNSRH